MWEPTTQLKRLARRLFTIAESVREKLCLCLSAAQFFSLLLDGSTDSGNIDNIIVLVVWFHQNGLDEKVYTRTSYFVQT